MTSKFAAALAAGAASLALCAGSAAAATTSQTPKSVYFIFTGYAYPYFAPMAEAVKQAASHYPDMTIKIVNANNSASDEIADINEAVAAGAQGIILHDPGVGHRDRGKGDEGRRSDRHRRSRRQQPGGARRLHRRQRRNPRPRGDPVRRRDAAR